MKKRSSGKPSKPPPARRTLQYKVVELSTVDESSLEAAVNEWVAKGWALENIQFAMRESSKRPAMAFVFFTRKSELALADSPAAKDKLLRLAERPEVLRPRSLLSARERLAQLAGEEDLPE